ncbi:hypothetical protein SCHPADRAFT_906293 [Schizopora paradoxa]|uniref:Uncharacterized protein n=1 Tax=Schizopora paradoxa TaxID=27342 RepID=A0A0H2RH03_9AGAM|nr:hypothetical protein SCHPADRAFT_906293 [Schizopora paradoxa]
MKIVGIIEMLLSVTFCSWARLFVAQTEPASTPAVDDRVPRSATSAAAVPLPAQTGKSENSLPFRLSIKLDQNQDALLSLVVRQVTTHRTLELSGASPPRIRFSF